jgi:S-adenosylmethionine hydrolase
MKPRRAVFAALLWCCACAHARTPLVLLTDFGIQDGAVAAMKGVAYSVSSQLLISDLSHDNPDIFTGAYRLYQAEEFWPKGTVFVCVIDPGVGTARLSVVLKTRNGHYFVGPDNGLLSLVAERDGIEALRQIDERVNRRKGSEDSHTFHGRDVYAYTGARLAAGVIRFEQVGPLLPPQTLIAIPYRKPVLAGERLTGLIPVLDVQYGNVWTNIPKTLFDQLHLAVGDPIRVRIYHEQQLIDDTVAPYRRTFGEVPRGQPLVYINSLMNVAVALNQGNYAAAHKVESGLDWFVELSKE